MKLANRLLFLLKKSCYVIARPRLKRGASDVENEYSDGWNKYWDLLAKADSLSDWLRIATVEDQPAFYNVNGELSYEAFDSSGYYRRELLSTLAREFPAATSITEFGAGLGRNLLFLKQSMPNLKVFGYELCRPGVEIARKAAEKFGIDVQYSQLDYVRSTEASYVFPPTDVAFTMFSLEQIPRANLQALRNILTHCIQGSIHIEPVAENYPSTYRGLLGRLEHWKVDYLSGFDRNVRLLDLENVSLDILKSSHNPLMFPSRYILRKASGGNQKV